MADNRWIDEDWSHDWLFWLSVVVALTGLVLSVALTDAPAWRLATGTLGLFGFTVCVVGFARTAWRAYRSE